MNLNSVSIGARGGGGISCVCVMRGMLEEGGDEKVTYEGGLRKCVLMKEGIRVKEIQRMLTESICGDFLKHKVCYSLKNVRQMLMLVEANVDVWRFSMEMMNMTIYMGDNDGLRRTYCNSQADFDANSHCGDLHAYFHGDIVDVEYRGHGLEGPGRTSSGLPNVVVIDIVHMMAPLVNGDKMFGMELHSKRKQNRSPVVEATDMGEENSDNESEESESAYENKEGSNGTSSSLVSLEEEEGISSNRKLGGDAIEE
ncbi:hypothetical protein Cgig2_030503 [Carnegiea gigantea]|uniref:Uncharacterized protein n=1 Tax=Carnegiea gigantea TaxID=171969 RepID=A0A9Q1JW14_9CARY|nr:hypothetical protein Cgig2_030503 [Carnegiea gigantea]